MTFTVEISLLGPDGSKRTATVSGESRQWVEHNLTHVECRLRLVADGFDLRSTATDFFAAFCGIREQLAEHGFYPLCYGASRNVYPSAMARDMAAGLKAYKIKPGKAVTMDDLVEIFATGPDVEPVSVKEQLDVFQKWIAGGD